MENPALNPLALNPHHLVGDHLGDQQVSQPHHCLTTIGRYWVEEVSCVYDAHEPVRSHKPLQITGLPT